MRIGVIVIAIGLLMAAAEIAGYEIPRVSLGGYVVLWGVLFFLQGTAARRNEDLYAALEMRRIMLGDVKPGEKRGEYQMAAGDTLVIQLKHGGPFEVVLKAVTSSTLEVETR